jgi:RHS repeat-associated protein
LSDVPVELILAKPLALPSAAPFGVSGGNFAIGEAPETEAVSKFSRSRALDKFRRNEDGKRTRLNDDSTLAGRKRSSEESDSAAKTAQARSVSCPSGKSTKLMSAAPVGNYYIYSFDGKLLQVYDIYGTLLKDFIYMGNRLIAEYDHVNGRLLYYTGDQTNSTRLVTDDVGSILYSAAFDPFGQIRAQTGSIDPLFKFSGKERDIESQLDYFDARYYDNSSYRFLSIDPLLIVDRACLDPQRWNLYSYCMNNPLTFIDPDGMDAISAQDGHKGRVNGCSQLWGHLKPLQLAA